MSLRTILLSLFIMFATNVSYGNYQGTTMHLVNKKTGYILAELDGPSVIIHDHYILSEIEENGIFIPPIMRDEFGGKIRVFFDDQDFQKAFLEVYYHFSVNNDTYIWQENN